MLCSLYLKKRIGRLHDSFGRLVKSLAVSAVDDLSDATKRRDFIVLVLITMQLEAFNSLQYNS